MGEKTGISWTTHTFNAWVGCHKVSAGCDHCYAEVSTLTRIQRGRGVELWGPPASTARMILSPDYWLNLRKWDEKARRAKAIDPKAPQRYVFMSSLSDFWERHPAVEEARAWALEMIAQCPHLIFQILTKRPENIVPILRDIALQATFPDAASIADKWLKGTPPPNVWLGVTAEGQEAYVRRWPVLAGMPAAKRFVSYEPAVHRLVLIPCETGLKRLPDWVIIGGESGVGARQFEVSWALGLIAQCRQWGVTPFMKQLGARTYGLMPDVEARLEGKADVMELWPKELQVQEFPS